MEEGHALQRPLAPFAAGIAPTASADARARRRRKREHPPPVWHVDLLRGGVELIDRLEDEWTDLCRRSAEDPPYCRPDWVRAYVANFVAPGALRVITARRAGQLHALIPLFFKRMIACGLPARRLRSATDDRMWRFDMLRAAGEPGEAALLALMRGLSLLRGWDFIELRDVPEGGAAADLLSYASDVGHAVARTPALRSPRMSLEGWDGSPEFFLKRTGTKFRGNMRRALREAGGALRLERVEGFDPADFEQFLALEASGWKGAERSAIACDPRARAFFEARFEAAARRGEFVLNRLWLGDRLVAATCSIEHRGCHAVIKGARDDGLRKLSPGHLVVHALLLDCAARGLATFDFIGVDEPWKLSWEPGILKHRDCYIFRRSLYGRALHASMFRLSPALRRLRQAAAAS